MNLKIAEQRVVRRDRREIIAAAASIMLFTYLSIVIPSILTKAAGLLCVISFGYMIFKLRQNRKSKALPDLSLPYKKQLQDQEAFMLRQAKLLDSVLYWYVLPGLGAQLLFIWSLEDPQFYNMPAFFLEHLPHSLSEKLLSTGLFTMIGAYIVWLNKRAVRVNWEPLIQQVQNIKKQLNSEE